MPTPMRTLFKGRKKAATREDIRAIIGPMDDTVITAILHTAATPDEVLLALEYLEEHHYTRPVFASPMDENIRRIYDILDYALNVLNGKSLGH